MPLTMIRWLFILSTLILPDTAVIKNDKLILSIASSQIYLHT